MKQNLEGLGVGGEDDKLGDAAVQRLRGFVRALLQLLVVLCDTQRLRVACERQEGRHMWVSVTATGDARRGRKRERSENIRHALVSRLPIFQTAYPCGMPYTYTTKTRKKGGSNRTHRRLLDDVQDGDGELRVREGVRLGVDFGHGVCRDCGGRRTFGQNGSDEGPRELPCRSAAIRSAPSREEGFFRGARSAHEGASKDAR